jgi:hypothetical protein
MEAAGPGQLCYNALPMRAWWKKWWPLGKALLAAAILVAIGRRFAEDLQEPALWDRSFRPGWMALSGALYMAAVGFSTFFWWRLMRAFGQLLSAPAAVRAYYVGFLGKYLPGKAWALVLRAGLARGPRVRAGLAGLTAFYEVLTNMAAGALLAGVLYLFLGPETGVPIDWPALRAVLRLEAPAGVVRDRTVFLAVAVALFVPLAAIIFPPVFNRLAHRVAAPFREPDAPPLPRLGFRALCEGLLLTGCGWFVLGASLWAMLEAVLTRPPAWTWHTEALLTAFMALAYVAGFVILFVPSGLGVREYFLVVLLTDPAAGRPRAVVLLTVLVLRLVWTAAELVVAGVAYWLPGPDVFSAPPRYTGGPEEGSAKAEKV